VGIELHGRLSPHWTCCSFGRVLKLLARDVLDEAIAFLDRLPAHAASDNGRLWVKLESDPCAPKWR
jgi:hypothetical protein